ncbi:MAG: DUF4363 family protein [Clostridia bacterium]|nr:DUF4363 family protein [Clostridia bacterium]MDD4685805.1 DUF4363 family protein [Clostridia bacterium]
MNKRFIYILIIIVLLVGFCIMEQLMVDNFLTSMETNIYNIMDIIEDEVDINTPEIYELVEETEEKWKGYENSLCYLINYKDIEEVGVEITKMKVYIVENQIVEFKSSLAQILYFTDSYRQVMSNSLHNII